MKTFYFGTQGLYADGRSSNEMDKVAACSGRREGPTNSSTHHDPEILALFPLIATYTKLGIGYEG